MHLRHAYVRSLVYLSICLQALCPRVVQGQFLFDATKAEMAGNADWVIDADLHNLNVGSGNGSGRTGGSDSNPQRISTPAASGITAATAETYWTGALSAWGVSLVQRGQSVETLPYNGAITYGNGSNAQDLSHYKVFVLAEANILFTTAEKTAILTFVQNGGGLFFIGDHGGSDRNNDGSDSVEVFNELMSNNSVKTNAFGVLMNGDDVSPTGPTVASSVTDPIIHGAIGAVTNFAFVDGTSMTIDLAQNSSVKGAVFNSTTRTSSTVMVAYGTFGAGRFVIAGDSSPFDDGSGDVNDVLFDGWNDGKGTSGGFSNDGRLAMNASLWLSVPEPGSSGLLCVGALGVFSRRWRRSYWATSSGRPNSLSTRG